jgi:hypothetical protein
VSKSGNSLVLTSVINDKYAVTYTREAIPESVKTHYMPATKATSVVPVL